MNFLEHLSLNYSPDIVEKIINSFSKERTHSFVLNTAKYSKEHLFDINIIKNHPFIDNAFYFENQKLGNMCITARKSADIANEIERHLQFCGGKIW